MLHRLNPVRLKYLRERIDLHFEADEHDRRPLAGPYDLITAMEVVEHVADVPLFLEGLAGALSADGLLVMSTPNRTRTSQLLLVWGAEALGRIPRGTHDWERFLTPEELTSALEHAGLEVIDLAGLGWSPTRGLHLTQDTSLNYLLTARRRV
jgi:2-polyprenyl-6-hydroxyphenyl methylase/3-demethylubiquinone-9 3-methyltransferase